MPVVKRSLEMNSLILAGGMLVAQAVHIISAPILTRVYSPESFGVLAQFLAIANIIGIIAGMRYETAIVLAKNNSDAKSLFALSIIISAIMSIVLTIIITMQNSGRILSIIKNDLEYLWYFVPIAILLFSIQNSMIMLAQRSNEFGKTSISNIIQSIIDNITKICLGLIVCYQYFGLVVGYVVGLCSSIIYLGKRQYQSELNKELINKHKIIDVGIKYRALPIYNSWATLLNALTLQLPVLMLGILFGSSTAGYYLLTNRILKTPARFIGQAISQSLFKEIADNRAQPLNIYHLTVKVIIILSSLFIIPFFIVLFAGEYLFRVFFGVDWAISGIYAEIMIPWVGMQFIASSISKILIAIDRTALLSMMQVMLFMATAMPFAVSIILGKSSTETIIILSISNTIAYAIYGISVIYACFESKRL